MQNLTRQDYKNSTFAEAREAGCDCFQLKYDGWWAGIRCLDGTASIYSQTGRLVTTLPIDPLIYGTFIGEFMHGTQWAQKQDRKGKVFLFDCWNINGQDTSAFPYRERYNLCRVNLPLFGERFRLVQNYPISVYQQTWDSLVATSEYEGVVFRRSNGPVSDTLHRQKRTITVDGIVVGFEPGEGKHLGRLGAIRVRLPSGTIVSVGGGFSDTERELIWQSQSQYLGRTAELKGNAEFESGSVRHPNFVRWREDR